MDDKILHKKQEYLHLINEFDEMVSGPFFQN